MVSLKESGASLNSIYVKTKSIVVLALNSKLFHFLLFLSHGELELMKAAMGIFWSLDNFCLTCGECNLKQSKYFPRLVKLPTFHKLFSMYAIIFVSIALHCCVRFFF